MSEKISIFLGADYPEWLPMQVLIYSIRRHTTREIEFTEITNDLVPEVTDPRHLPYTRFSFGRFAIPKLKEFQGKAIYLDSDMLVFRDISELWDTPFSGAKILNVDPGRDGGSTRRNAVMLMDCEKLRWDPDQVIAGLGRDYGYKELMSFAPLLSDNEFVPGIRYGWNCRDIFNEETRLLHYTNIMTQPWVAVGSELRGLWVDELCHMLNSDALSITDIEREIKAENIRPSLVREIEARQSGNKISNQVLIKIDQTAGYGTHRELNERHKKREHAKWAYERSQNPTEYTRNIYRKAFKDFCHHPIKFLFKKNYKQHLERLNVR